MPLLECGVLFAIIGLYLCKFPPKKINMFYGYRTNRSMRNQEVWDFAQTYSAKLMVKLGFVLILVSPLGLLFDITETIKIVLTFAFIIILCIVLIMIVETELKKRFDEKK